MEAEKIIKNTNADILKALPTELLGRLHSLAGDAAPMTDAASAATINGDPCAEDADEPDGEEDEDADEGHPELGDGSEDEEPMTTPRTTASHPKPKSEGSARKRARKF